MGCYSQASAQEGLIELPYVAKQACTGSANFIKNMKVRFGMLPLVKGVEDGKTMLMILWVNPKTGDWVLTNRYPNGFNQVKRDITCMFEKGNGISSVFKQSYYFNLSHFKLPKRFA